MHSGPVSIERDALLAHQDFVLALARSLLRDEHAAHDVAQETWITALTRPPRSASSLKAWLARVTYSRAGERLRREARRTEQERFASRSDVDESSEHLRERLALQHQVVAAVLELRDPYRTTILQHYYEGLSASDIARKEGIPAGTVRARISRAHDALREALDSEFGGSRTGWMQALGLFVEVGATKTAVQTWIIAASITAAAVIPITAWVGLTRARGSDLGANEVARAVEPVRSNEPVIDPPAVELVRVPLAAAAISPALPGSEAMEASIPQGAAKEKGVAARIENGGFEDKAGKDDPIPGWKLIVGATNGANEPLSVGKLDTKEKHSGHASLMLSGDDTTRAWRAAQQTFDDVKPGGTYHLTGWTKTKDVHPENVKGTKIGQFVNCFVVLIFKDDNGEEVASDLHRATVPTANWQSFTIDVKAPESARSALISISLTMSGTLWVDDMSLTVEGGHDLPPKEVLVDESFENITGLPNGWEESVGATNGGGSTRSTLEVDRGTGANGSHASLHFAGDKSTVKWMTFERKLDARPGDAVTMRAMVRAENVRKEGIQFQNLHMHLLFYDSAGQPLGAVKSANPGTGTYDWKQQTVTGVAPEGAVQVLAGIFLSMSGDAWFDDLHIEKRSGGQPAYADWLTLETKHLTLRYPKDNPRAGQMKQYGEKLDRAFEDVVKALGVDYTDRITMYIYRDGEQGKNLTGRELDYANPEGRAVHQGPNSTLSHEMVHCIALKMGTAQTGLFGEGIAVWLNGDTPAGHHDRAAKLLAKGELPSLKDLLDAFRDQTNGYPAAGSFCGYLIENFGMAKFKALYPTTDPRAEAESVLGKSLDAVDEEWRNFLSRRK